MLLFILLAALSLYSQEHSPDALCVLLLRAKLGKWSLWDMLCHGHCGSGDMGVAERVVECVFWAAQGKQPFLRCAASTFN